MKDEDSYKLTPDSPEANTDWRDDKNRSKGMKPLVDKIKPPKMPKKKKEGLLGWIKNIAGIETEVKPKPKPARSNNNNNNRNRTRKPRPQNQNRNPNQKKAPNQANPSKNPNQNKAPANKSDNAKPMNARPANTNPNAKPSNPTPRPKKDVDGNVAPNKVDKAIKSESVKKPVEKKVESVSTKPKDIKPTPKPAAKKEPAIREIVREPKAKREVPTMASNDPRRKS
jgi:ribonuclease E